MTKAPDPAPERKDGITRRDFLDGMAIGAAGLAVAAAAPHLTGAEAALAAPNGRPRPPQLPPGYYPPTVPGGRGHPDNVVADIIRIDGPPNPDDPRSSAGGPGVQAPNVDTGEVYDCVVVGAGASGLAAAKFYFDRFGPDAKILVLDPLPDFGGHSTRNEFHIPNAAAGGASTMLLRNGGTVNLDSVGTWNQPAGPLFDIPGEYFQPALDLLDFCEVDPNNFVTPRTNNSIPGSYGLRSMLLFAAEDWGSDTVERTRFEPNNAAGWTSYVNRLPYSQAAKDAIVRIQTDATDWLVAKHGPMSDAEKKALLTGITYKQYLMEYVGAPEEAIAEYQRGSHSLLGAGAQVVSAADSWALGRPGFLGVELEEESFPGIGRTPQLDFLPGGTGPSPAWPDGNASLLRLLLSKLIPPAFGDVDGDRPNQENIVKADCDYTKLDRPENNLRIRLNSLAFKVKPGNPNAAGGSAGSLATVDYKIVDPGRRPLGFRVRATHVVMACWNRVTAQIVNGLPREQVENLTYARKVPLIYGRVGLNNWRAFADAQISNVAPRGDTPFWDTIALEAGARFGNAYGPTPNEPPEVPAILRFQTVPTGHHRTPQTAAYEEGRQRLLEMSFADLEDSLFDMLDRTVNRSGGDFDPERDVNAVMTNRWNYGYAHELTSMWDSSIFGPTSEQPHVKGRVPFRNVSIANSDSQAMAYTHAAIQEGYRAIQDLPETAAKKAKGKKAAASAT